MKKLLVGMLVLSTLVVMVGCNDKKSTESNNKTVKNEEVENNNSGAKKRSNKEMYKIYERLLPEMKSYYENLGYEIKEEKDENLSDYDKNTSITYNNSNNKNKNECTRLLYGLVTDPSGELSFLGGSMYMNIDGEEFKGGNFKIEETPFYEVIKIFGADKLDFTEVNEKINDYYNGNGSDLVQKEEGEYSFRFNLGQSKIAYIININP